MGRPAGAPFSSFAQASASAARSAKDFLECPLGSSPASWMASSQLIPFFYEHPAVKGVTVSGYVVGNTFRNGGRGSWINQPQGLILSGNVFINNTTNTLSYVTLKYTGEIWRNQPRSNSLVFSYYIDTTGTNAFSPTNDTATFVPSMDVNFNTNAAGLLVLDGTQSSNQISLAVTNLAIGSWPTNAAAWNANSATPSAPWRWPVPPKAAPKAM